MEAPLRTLMKAISWQLLGIATMTGLALYQMGDLFSAFSLAVSASVSGFIFYFLHERIWAKVRWGLRR